MARLSDVPLKPFAPILPHACGTSDKLLSLNDAGNQKGHRWDGLVEFVG
jgi:hypothetical protein